MNIWIFQTGEPLHSDVGNPRAMRAMNLANSLIDCGHSVIIWSSAFFHQYKKHRTREYQIIKVKENLEIRLIPSSGYKRNMGIKRFFDHVVLALNLKKVLIAEELIPDVAFVGYPPIEFCAVASSWLYSKNVPFYLDVKDQWPNIFVDSVPSLLRPFARFGFQPYYSIARKTMKQATAITSVTKSFLDWSINFAERNTTQWDTILPLVSSPTISISSNEIIEAEKFWMNMGIDITQKRRFIYIGNLTEVLDFQYVYSAAKIFQLKSISCDFIICGNGVTKENLKTKFNELKNVIFVDHIDLPKVRTLMACSLAIFAPYKSRKDFVMSIPNKFIDSFAYGLPIITGLAGEVENLIVNYDAGIFCKNSEESWVNAFRLLLEDSDKQNKMANNAKQVYIRHFDFNLVYNTFVHKLEELHKNKIS